VVALVSAGFAGLLVLILVLAEAVRPWWLLIFIGLGAWFVLYFIFKVIIGRLDGKSFGEAAGGAVADIGDFGGSGGGSSCGSGGCGSGGGGD